MGLKHSYTLLAPIYDAIVAAPTKAIRKSSLSRLEPLSSQKILINGIGTGLDLPYLPAHHFYTATDLTPAMLDRCSARLHDFDLNINLETADVMQLPYEDNQFDIIVMHLILAVVPDPLLALKESLRVLKPGGSIYILDKFLRPNQIAPVRKLLNIFIRHIATRTDVVFENLLQECKQLQLIEDQPVLLGGWFRKIELKKINL